MRALVAAMVLGLLNADPCSLDMDKGTVDRNLPPLLISAHKKLYWFHSSTDSFALVHEGHGAYYSVITDAAREGQLWVVSTYRDLQAGDNPDTILHLQLNGDQQAAILQKYDLQSKNTHSAIRAGNKLLVVNTRDGSVDQYSFPNVEFLQSFALFRRRDHLNSIALADDTGDSFWVLRHGRQHGVKADMVKVTNGGVVDTISDTGFGSHAIVFWKNFIVYMSARPASIWTVDLQTRQHNMLWTHDNDPNCGNNQPFFAKGLTIVNDIAYFGLSRFETKREGRMSVDVVLFAVDLSTGKVSWQRRMPPNSGLVNEVTVPSLGPNTSWRAVTTGKSEL